MPEIDERRVVMDFDYSQFASGAMAAIGIIDKVESAINFTGRSTGFDRIAESFGSITASIQTSSPDILNAIESISNRFTTLGIIGQEVTRRIANSAMDMLGQVTNGISNVMNQIQSGGSSRALNLEQARFMLKGLTGDLEQVEDIISGPVNDAVSGTRFGLDAAAVAAANLYASGITGSEELTKSLQAISGAATMTNREYGDMADIFATIKSNGKLMTMQLRQFSAMGMNVSAELAKALGKSEQQINEMVTDGKITYEQFVDVMYRYWDLAADANSTYAGSLANVNAQLSKIGEVVASKYYSSMIGVNNALIVFIKAVKADLEPAYEVINNAIEKGSKALATFISDSRTLKTVHNIVRGLVNIMQTLEPIIEAVGKAFKVAFPGDLLDSMVKISKQFKNITKSFKDYMNVGEDKKMAKVLKTRKEDSKQLHKIIKQYGLFNDKAIEKAKVSKEEYEILSKNLKVNKDSMNTAKSALSVYKKETKASLDKLNAQKSQSKRLHEIVERYGLLNEHMGQNVILSSKEQKLVSKTLKLKAGNNKELVKELANFDKSNQKLEREVSNRKKKSKQMSDIIKRYELMHSAKTKDIKLSEKDQKFVEKTLGIDAKHLSNMKKKLKAYDDTTKALKKQAKEQNKQNYDKSGTANVADGATAVFNRFKQVLAIGKDLTSVFELFARVAKNAAYALEPVLVPLRGFVDLSLKLGKVISETIKSYISSFEKLGIIEDIASNVRKFLEGILPNDSEMDAWIDKFVSGFKKAIPTFEQLTGLFNKVGGALKDFHDRIFGINAVFNLLAKLGEKLAGLKKLLTEPIHTFVKAITDLTFWDDERVDETPEFIQRFLEDVLVTFVNGIMAIVDFITGIGKKVGKVIGDLAAIIKKAVSIDLFQSTVSLSKILDVLSGAIALFFANKKLAHFDTLFTGVKNFEDTFTVISGYARQLKGILGNISGAFNEFTKTLKIAQLVVAAAAIGILAGALVIFSNVDADKVSLAVSSLSVLMFSLTGAMGLLRKVTMGGEGLASMAAGFVIMAEGVKILAKALVIVSKIDSDSMANGLLGLAAVMAMLVKMAQSLNGAVISPKSMLAVVVYVLAIKLMIGSLKEVTRMIQNDMNSTFVAFALLEAILWSMFGFVAAVNKLGPKLSPVAPMVMSSYLTVVEEMVIVLAALMALVAADKIAGFPHLAIAFGLLQALMWSMFGFVAALNALAPDLKLKPVIILALYIAEVGSLVISLGILRSMVKDDLASTLWAFALLEVLLWSMVGFVKALDTVTIGSANALKSIAAVVAISESIMNLADSFVKVKGSIGQMSPSEIGSIAATMVVLESLIWTMVGILVVLDKINSMSQFNNLISMFTLMALVFIIDQVVEIFISIKEALGNITNMSELTAAIAAFVVLEALVWSLIGALKVISLIDPKRSLTGVIAVTLLATSVKMMVNSLIGIADAINSSGPKAIIGAFVMLEAILWSMVGVLAVLSTMAADPRGMASLAVAAGSLIIMAAALAIIVPAIVMLGAIGPLALVGAVALAAVLGVLTGFGMLASNFPQIAAGLMSISLSIAAFGMSLAALGFGISMLSAGVLKAVTSLYALGTTINTLTPELVKNISEGVPLLMEALGAIISEFLIMIATFVPQVTALGLEIILAFIGTVADNIDKIVSTAADIIVQFCLTLAKNTDRIVDAALKLIIALIDGLASAIDNNGPKIKKACMHLIKSIVGFIIGKENADKMFKAAKKLIDGFVKGVKTWWSRVKHDIELFGKFFKAAWKVITDPEQLKELGKLMIDGLIKGVKSKVDAAVGAIKGLGNKVISGFKSVLGIASPSKVFYELAGYVLQGFVNGIDDSTAAAKKQIQKAFKKIMPKIDDFNINMDVNLDKAYKQLSKYKNKYDNLVDTRSKEKKELKGLNENLKKEFQFRKTSKKFLTKSQKTELNYLQQKLQIEGTLTDKEFKRMGTLLGLSPKQQKALEDELARRKDISKEIDKNTEKISKYKKLINELTKEIASGSVYSVGKSKEMYDAAAESLMKFGESLYKNTDEYKENTAQINSNKESIKSLQNSIDDLTKKREHQQSVINGVRNSLYNYLSTGNLALEYEKKNGKLTKDAEKQRNKDIKSLEKLQGKLRENGKLSKEEYLELARLLGIKGKNLETIKAQILLLEDYSGQLNETNSDLKDAKAAVTELENANKELGDAIENGPIAKLTELHDKVKETISNALNPLKESIEDNISMFDKFSVTELAEKFDMSTLIGNVASFGNVWAQWEKDLNRFLSDSRYSDQVKQYVESLGPAAANMLKVLLAATDEEIRLTNEAFFSSQEAEVDQWLSKIESKVEAQRKFYENLKILRDVGLSDEAYRALMEEGYEAAGSIVDGLISGLGSANGDENISRLNAAYKNYLTIPEEMANQAMMDAAASFEGLGGTLYDALIKGMASGLFDQKNIDSMREGLQSFVDAVYAPDDTNDEVKQEVETAGTATGVVYIDGMATAIDENGNLVTAEAKDVGKDANKGVQQYLSASNGSEIGRQMDNGLVAGLYENGGAVAAAATAVAYQAYAAAMAALAIASPSKKFAEIGMYADLGFAAGLIKYTGSVTSATASVADSSMETMRSKLSELSDTLSDSANAPVIRPILDLSGVEAGAATVKRMFESTHMSASGGAAMGDEDVVSTLGGGSNYVFNQYNTSPKALSRIDIYRQTNNQFAMFRRATT